MNSSSVCPDGKLSLGYSFDFFPYFYQEKSTGNFRGITIEPWIDIAKYLGCPRGLSLRKYLQQRDDQPGSEVYNGALDRGEVLTAIESSWLRDQDPKRYRLSAVVAKTTMSFVEAREASHEESTSLSFYIVYPLNVLVILITVSLIISALNLLHARFTCGLSRNRVHISTINLLRDLLFQFALLFVYLIYTGYFSGNTLKSLTTTTTFSSMVNAFKAGRRKLVLNERKYYFWPEEIPIIMGSNSSIVFGQSTKECLEMVCGDSSRVGLFYQPDIYAFYTSTLSTTCTLTEIVLPEGQSTGVDWLTQSIQSGDPYHYLLSRSQSRRTIEKINFVLLSVFTQDNLNNLILRRSLDAKDVISAARQQQYLLDSTQLPPFTSISFTQIEIPLILLGVGLIISVFGFVVELLWARCRQAPSQSNFMANYSLCQNGRLPLGYSSDFFPYFYYDKSSLRFRGVAIELWESLSKSLGCHSGIDLQMFDKQREDAIGSPFFDGALDRGEVITAIETSWLRKGDVNSFRYSTTVARTTMVFVEARDIRVDKITSLSFYVVFPIDFIAILFVLTAIIFIINHFQSRFRKGAEYLNRTHQVPYAMIDLLRGLLFQFAIVTIYLTYQGYFNGNNLTASIDSPTSFNSMVADFHAGKRKLVIKENENYFDPDQIPIFVGSSSSIIEGETVEKCLELVCSDSSRVGLFYKPDIDSFYASSLADNCTLTEVVLPMGQSAGLTWITQSLHSGDPYNFILSRSKHRSVIEKINFALHTVFTQDNLNSFLLRRNLIEKDQIRVARGTKSVVESIELPPYNSISFTQVEIPIKILGGGLLMSVFMEIIITKMQAYKLKITKHRSEPIS